MQIKVVHRVLEKNEQAAAENRTRLNAAGVACVNLLGGAGCGKTSLLELVLPRLRPTGGVAVLEGDLTTTRDAERIAALNVPVLQLMTDGGCHLSATMVARALDELPLTELDLLIIENVGNPICPANFDLGEHARVVMLSTTEGHDKPGKYPGLFKNADLVVLSKCDLLPHVEFDAELAEADLRRVNPRATLIRTDRRTQQGVVEVANWFDRQRRSTACGS